MDSGGKVHDPAIRHDHRADVHTHSRELSCRLRLHLRLDHGLRPALREMLRARIPIAFRAAHIMKVRRQVDAGGVLCECATMRLALVIRTRMTAALADRAFSWRRLFRPYRCDDSAHATSLLPATSWAGSMTICSFWSRRQPIRARESLSISFFSSSRRSDARVWMYSSASSGNFCRIQ